MKNRIWMKVEALKLYQLTIRDKGSSAWGILKVGHSGFEINAFLFTLEKSGYISQNPAMAKVRLLDVPAAHLSRGRKKHGGALLELVLAKAVYDEYLTKRQDELTVFIKEGKRSDLPYFTPSDWKGHLRIPVEFIELSNLSCGEEGGSVYADIRIGHHLIFWRVPVYTPGNKYPFRCQTKEINDQRIVSAINKLLAKKKVRDYLKYIHQSHRFCDPTVFVDGIPGYQIDIPPPRIRFY